MAEPKKGILLSDLMTAGPKPRKAFKPAPPRGMTYMEARKLEKEQRNVQA
jgi:hypothetical protein